MDEDADDPVAERRIAPRVGAYLSRPTGRAGLGLIALAIPVLVAAGAWHEQAVIHWALLGAGTVSIWVGFVVLARSEEREWPQAIGWGTALYLAPALGILVAGDGLSVAALAWPYALVTAAVNCPLGLPCPIGR